MQRTQYLTPGFIGQSREQKDVPTPESPVELSKAEPKPFVPCQGRWAGRAPSPAAHMPLGLAQFEALAPLNCLTRLLFPQPLMRFPYGM